MDSGNSGSLQSSSGGDEEYDSRAAADSISTFMTGPISNPPAFFDPISNYLHQHQNPLLNSAPSWPVTRPDSNHLMMNSTLPTSSPNFMPSFQPAPPPRVDNSPTAAPPAAAARGSKKRSRASRRAPTTVLTTDTTNFRAMVQEFTGIPSPPFNNSSSFPRNRLDLFSTRSAAPPPPYLRRPFPQKPHAATAAAAASSSYQLQLPISQNSNLFNNIPNPLLTSFLQSNPNPKFPLFSNTAPKMGGLGLDEQFGSGPDNLAGLQNLIHQNDAVTSNNGSSRWNEGDRREGGPENVESWICSSE